MGKKRLKVALVVLDAVKSRFPGTKSLLRILYNKMWKIKDYCRRDNFLQV